MDSRSVIRPDTPIPAEMNSLRTPSMIYNHGGYYGPVDPRDCETPNGPCSSCHETLDAALTLCSLCEKRPSFLEPCPSCGNEASYMTHAKHGVPTVCPGCDDKICNRCWHGCRYMCALPVMERQLTNDKWEDAEWVMKEDPFLTELIVMRIGVHVYKVVRTEEGVARVHEIR